jgi:hypothetical protein
VPKRRPSHFLKSVIIIPLADFLGKRLRQQCNWHRALNFKYIGKEGMYHDHDS